MPQGSSLPELLISLFLLSFLLLALNTMQLTAFRQTKAVYYYRSAMQQAENMRLKLNAPLSSEEINEWNKQNLEILPQGQGTIESINQQRKIKISWGGMTLQECSHNSVGTKGCILT